MSKYKIYSFIFLLSLLTISCKTSQFTTDAINKSLPEKFDSSPDSLSLSAVKWKEIFFDRNLVSLIDSALKNNYDLRLTLQKVEIAKANLKSHRGIRLPDLAATISAGQRKFGDYTMDGVGNYDTQFSPNINNKQQIPNPLPDFYAGFQSSWEIDLWGKLKNRKKAAAARFIASQYGKDLIITNLIAEISAAYFELMGLDSEIQILTENIELQQSALELVSAQKEAGKANELAVEMMSAQLLNSKTRLSEVQQLLLETESNLNFLCGFYPKKIVRDTNQFSQRLKITLDAGVPSELIKNRADIREAEFELIASNADVNAAQAAFYPGLNINAALGLQSFNALLLTEMPASLAYNVLGGLTTPLLNRRNIKAALMAKKGEQKQAYINYEKVVVNSFREVYVAVNSIKNTKTIYDLKEKEVAILKKAIITSTELFKAGRAGYLEVITSQKNTLHAQIELINFYKRQNIALVDLYRATGGGWK